MAEQFLNIKNLKFILHDVIGTDDGHREAAFAGKNRKTIDMVLDAAYDFAKKELHPIFEEMDRNQPELKDGIVKVHPKVKNIMRTLGKDGWIAAGFSEEWDGENMPASIIHACSYIFAAANYSGSVYAGLSMGAAKLIDSFGDMALKQEFIPKLLSGEWQGTMALTEPEAGTSLSDMTTEAVSQDNGSYRVKGQKIFISAGDHDAVDNVIHLMLARIKGAPAGVRGISLFVVPKLRQDVSGTFVSNDVTVTQVFHKLGYRGAPITELSMGDKDDCHAFLVGEVNMGLKYMFQMMNGARLEVGMGAAAISTAAYHAALNYTKSRKQGRRITDKGSANPVSIIEHADVKRMLLFQRAVSEGSLSLILQCSYYEDLITILPKEEREDYHFLLELLTPVAKTYPAEMGILSTSQSIQCFGGYGYCEDFPVEQHFRDMRIHTIHEGTTGIQGMDLLGRKVVMNNGKVLTLLGEKIGETIAVGKKISELSEMAFSLEQAFTLIASSTEALGAVAMEKGAEAFLADATLYLEMFGHVVIAWQWLKQAVVATEKLSSEKIKKTDKVFFEGKLSVGQYFYRYELPKASTIAGIITQGTATALSVEAVHFS